MITMQAWMFLNGFKKLRHHILSFNDLVSMIHLGSRAFDDISGEVVQTTAFVIRKKYNKLYLGKYVKLIDMQSSSGKEECVLRHDHEYTACQTDFLNIDGAPITYWLGHKMAQLFRLPEIKEKYDVSNCIQPGDTALFLRLWYEVSKNNVVHGWRFVSKGGSYRKWYGNIDYIINYGLDGEPLLVHPNTTLRGKDKYFQAGVVWNRITMGDVCFRVWDKRKTGHRCWPILYADDYSILGFPQFFYC